MVLYSKNFQHHPGNAGYIIDVFFFFFFFFFSRDQLTKQKKNVTKNTPSCSLELLQLAIIIIIIIQLACTCAYNIDDLFHTGRIDRSVWKRSSILYAHTPDIYVAIRFT